MKSDPLPAMKKSEEASGNPSKNCQITMKQWERAVKTIEMMGLSV